ncbi:MAG: GNAT family N-acetyltransferase, partial [Candidatus Saccharibacteria bacterium]|nr:GNAT family N-acetyltransferase [Rhodoferax sp.]
MTKHPLIADEDIASLERATLDAVAPLEVREMADWLLPLDRSTIGRAKSAVPLRHTGLRADALDAIETAYLDWGIEARFRVADVPGLGNIHQRLRAMGYAPEQPTLVQVGTVNDLLALPAAATVRVDTAPNERWASVYTAPGFDAVDGTLRVQALSRSAHA